MNQGELLRIVTCLGAKETHILTRERRRDAPHAQREGGGKRSGTGGRSDRRGGIMRSRLLLALTAAALVTAVTAAPSLAVAASGIPPAIPGTSGNFELVGTTRCSTGG